MLLLGATRASRPEHMQTGTVADRGARDRDERCRLSNGGEREQQLHAAEQDSCDNGEPQPFAHAKSGHQREPVQHVRDKQCGQSERHSSSTSGEFEGRDTRVQRLQANATGGAGQMFESRWQSMQSIDTFHPIASFILSFILHLTKTKKKRRC